MKTSLLPLLALGLVLQPLAFLRADLDPSIVPENARWVVSLDLETLRQSALGKELLPLVDLPSIGPGPTVSIRPDPQKLLATITTATAYGTRFSKDEKEPDGVLLLQGTADLRTLAEAYVAQATVTTPDAARELKELPFEAYLLQNKVILGFPKEPIVLIGRSKAQLVQALEVFRTHRESISRGKSPLTALLPKPSAACLVAAGVVPLQNDFATGDGPQARVLQMANSGSLSISTDATTTSAHLTLGANSEEMAEKLQKIIQGVAAMASLTETRDKDLAAFLQSVRVQRTDKQVSLALTYPTEGIVRMVKGMNSDTTHIGNHVTGHRAPAGEVLAEWAADQDIGQPAPTQEGLATRTIEDIPLKNGTLVILTGHRDQGEHARIDYVEILPSAGGQPLRFEAENMKLSGYRSEPLPFASRGKLILLTHETGTAQFEFPGADDTCTLKVRYVDETDGKATFTVSIQTPDQPAESE
ncbi:MAG: hypothetical protein IPL39_06845 [Opitutaceae bacterium]|nr:hypothetical protein [Opitutaceae bacterium]